MARMERVGSAPAIGFGWTAAAALLRFAAWCRACAERRRQRHFLGTLDDRALRDIGLTPGQARRETSKPFWRA